MKKIIGSALSVTLTAVLSACGGTSNGSGNGTGNGFPAVPSTSTHVATTLNQAAEMTLNGSWTVSNSTLKCGGASKTTTNFIVYTFNSATNTGTYSVIQGAPAQSSQNMGSPQISMLPPMKQTVNFTMNAIDTTSFSIQTIGSMKCTLLDGTPCPTAFVNSANSNVPAGSTIDFQYILNPNGSSITLSVNDQTDILSCGLGSSNSSSFTATR